MHLPIKMPASVDVIAAYGSLTEKDRLQYPQDVVEIGELMQEIGERKKGGAHIAIVDGAFDVPTDSHVWWLRHCRLLAALEYYGHRFEKADWDNKRRLVAGDQIFLIATVDADEKVAARKSNLWYKGGIERPVYDWVSRANRIGGYMIPDGHGKFRPVVDLVTVEGSSQHRDTPLESHITFGKYLANKSLLDSWILCDDHEQLLEANNLFRRTTIVPKRSYARDPRTGATWSSTYVIGRIAGTDTSSPI